LKPTSTAASVYSTVHGVSGTAGETFQTFQ